MKKETRCFSLIKNMIDCICNYSDDKKSFDNYFFQLRKILINEYFTPFDREDIFMIAIKLNTLFKETESDRITLYIMPLLEKIRNIILLFEEPEKSRLKKLFSYISEYYNIVTDEILFSVSVNEKQKIENVIKLCNETVIQIEYTLLKNS